MIGERNVVNIPNSVQVGCEIDAQIPIVNMTRHRLHYYINMYDQYPRSDVKPPSDTSLSSSRYPYEGLDEAGEEENEDTERQNPRNGLDNDNGDISDVEFVNSKSSTTTLNTYSTITSIETTQSLDVLKNRNTAVSSSNADQRPFVFKFDKPTGELGPNEKTYLKLSFCPLKCVLYTANVKCYLMCNNFQEIINILPVIVKGNGCKTQLEVNAKSHL